MKRSIDSYIRGIVRDSALAALYSVRRGEL